MSHSLTASETRLSNLPLKIHHNIFSIGFNVLQRMCFNQKFPGLLKKLGIYPYKLSSSEEEGVVVLFKREGSKLSRTASSARLKTYEINIPKSLDVDSEICFDKEILHSFEELVKTIRHKFSWKTAEYPCLFLDFAFNLDDPHYYNDARLYSCLFPYLGSMKHVLNIYKHPMPLSDLTVSRNKTSSLLGASLCYTFPNTLSPQNVESIDTVSVTFNTPIFRVKSTRNGNPSSVFIRSTHFFTDLHPSSRQEIIQEGSPLREINILMPLGEEDLEDTQVVVPPQEKRSKKSAGVPPHILELEMFFLVIRQKELYQTLENKMNIEIDRIMLAKEELKSKKMIDLLQVFQIDDHWYNQMGVKARARLRGVKPIEFAVDPVILEALYEMFNCDEPQGIHNKNPLAWYPRELLLKKSLLCFKKICLAQNMEYWKALAAVLGKDGLEDGLFTFRPKFRKMCIFGSCDGNNTTLVQEYFKSQSYCEAENWLVKIVTKIPNYQQDILHSVRKSWGIPYDPETISLRSLFVLNNLRKLTVTNE